MTTPRKLYRLPYRFKPSKKIYYEALLLGVGSLLMFVVPTIFLIIYNAAIQESTRDLFWSLPVGLIITMISILATAINIGVVFGLKYLYRIRHRYEIAPKRVRMQEGIIHSQVREVKYKTITDIKIKQNLMERVFNYGTLYINTAGSPDYAIVMHKIDRPEQVKEVINKIQIKEDGEDGNN